MIKVIHFEKNRLTDISVGYFRVIIDVMTVSRGYLRLKRRCSPPRNNAISMWDQFILWYKKQITTQQHHRAPPSKEGAD